MDGIVKVSEIEDTGPSQFETVDDIIKVTGASLIEILKRVDVSAIQRVLRIASPELQQKIMIVIDQVLSNEAVQEMNVPLQKVTVEESRQAQTQLLRAAIELEKSGKLNME